MNDFTLDDAAMLINYYRQKVSDLEYQVLQLQLQLNKAVHTHGSTDSDSAKQDSKASKTKIEK